jgi:hypothetical protein
MLLLNKEKILNSRSICLYDAYEVRLLFAIKPHFLIEIENYKA